MWAGPSLQKPRRSAFPVSGPGSGKAAAIEGSAPLLDATNTRVSPRKGTMFQITSPRPRPCPETRMFLVLMTSHSTKTHQETAQQGHATNRTPTSLHKFAPALKTAVVSHYSERKTLPQWVPAKWQRPSAAGPDARKAACHLATVIGDREWGADDAYQREEPSVPVTSRKS